MKHKTRNTVKIILGTTLSLGALNFLPLLDLKTRNMQAYNLEGIIVYAEKKDLAEGKIIVEKIKNSSQKINASLRFAEEQNVDIIIYPNRKVLHRKTFGYAGWFLPDWYIGKNTKNYVMITSPSEPGPQHTRESIKKAAVHEYVHALTDRKNKKIDYWMKEAFALYLANQKPERSSIFKFKDITFSEYKTQNPIKFAGVGGYSLSYTFMEYLKNEFGWERIIGFLDPEKSFEMITGKSEIEVFNDWKTWLEDY
ncbi:hypothetical protein EXM22_01320 [Oceanispirochaeta crateris]|uniref:Peptidase MA-like domain-containing protein n=1 Tax=Oceanispirochaeta crateris TaxID=2518645 RepID=A0A5C1QJL1_9SPIO|nr:hypothetical protein [Oceanispirochaeta crateris]QEN06696.1 hypothetical protein EXM22_01320 [Oceanispirochaeta crateris]